jgi:ATP-dependent Lon protease
MSKYLKSRNSVPKKSIQIQKKTNKSSDDDINIQSSDDDEYETFSSSEESIDEEEEKVIVLDKKNPKKTNRKEEKKEEDKEEEKIHEKKNKKEKDVKEKKKDKNINILFKILKKNPSSYDEEYEDDYYYSDEIDSEEEYESEVEENEDEDVSTDDEFIHEDKEEENKDEEINNKILTDESFIQLNQLVESNPKNKTFIDILEKYKIDFQKNEKKKKNKELKRKGKNERIFKKIISNNKKNNDISYFKKIDLPNQISLIKHMKDINKIIKTEKPFLFDLLETNHIPIQFKSIAIKKIQILKHTEPGTSEYNKIKNWIDTFMKIPFGKYEVLPVHIDNGVDACHDFLESSQNILNECVYGMDDSKMQIIQMVGQFISNPNSFGTAIGIGGPAGTGKCLVYDTPVLMYDGSIKMVQDIQIDELIMGDDSTPRKILSLGTGEDELYEIISDYGDTYGVNGEHILCLKHAFMDYLIKENELVDEYDEWKFKVEFVEGNHITKYLYKTKKEAETFLKLKKEENNIIEITVNDYLTLPLDFQFDLKGYFPDNISFPFQSVPNDPYDVGMTILTNMYIPHCYLINHKEIQLKLLAGMIDGYAKNICNYYYSMDIPNHYQIEKDLLFLCRSLGFIVKKNENELMIYGKHIDTIPVLKTSKCISLHPSMHTTLFNIHIVPKGIGRYYGFELNGNHRYILGNCIVTHNTSLVKDGISKILKRPFAFIPLGGSTDSSYLEGHSYTYEGSMWGKIVQILIDCQCMNPVIYFDELDKISDTPKGEEIVNILIHLTDITQNNQFHDKYFSEFYFDLSKCLFIFSYNDIHKVNPILRDRMYQIHTKPYSIKEKHEIINHSLIKKIQEQVNISSEMIVFSKDIFTYIIDNYCGQEEGVRNLKRCIEIIYTKLNLYRLMKPDKNLFKKNIKLNVIFPYELTKNAIDELLQNNRHHSNKPAYLSMII